MLAGRLQRRGRITVFNLPQLSLAVPGTSIPGFNPTPTVRRHSLSANPSVIMAALDGGALSLPLKGREIVTHFA